MQGEEMLTELVSVSSGQDQVGACCRNNQDSFNGEFPTGFCSAEHSDWSSDLQFFKFWKKSLNQISHWTALLLNGVF